MIIQEYLNTMRNIQEIILNYIDNENQAENSYENLISFLNERVEENEYIFRATLYLISRISQNHHQQNSFYDKVIQILANFKNEITKSFTNFEIFNIFKSNKRILLFLLKENILQPDEYIAKLISTKKYKNRYYPHYFYPEFKSLFESTFSNKIKEEISIYTDDDPVLFEQQRTIGQNEAVICKLIREDSLNEFISYCSKNRIRFTNMIDFSIFETNSFLYDKQQTLMEYVVFFGSIQIFKYLVSNEVKLTPSLWHYSIHGKNSEIIHFLEDKNLNPYDKLGMQMYDEPYEKCLIESIKCHHNDLANYILNNFIKNKDQMSKKRDLLNIKYFNYHEYPDDFLNEIYFYWFCKIDESFIVDYILKNEDFDLNKNNEILYTSFFFMYDVSLYVFDLIEFLIYLFLILKF